MTRRTTANVVWSGDVFNIKPPPFPFLRSRMSAFRNSSRIFSKNLSGICFFSAISLIKTGPWAYRAARYSRALIAYWAFFSTVSMRRQIINKSKNGACPNPANHIYFEAIQCNKRNNGPRN